MIKKFIWLMIMLLLPFSLVGCKTSEEDRMKIPFELSNKTTNYFDTDGREDLLKIVNSFDELTQLIEEKEFLISTMYEESFFNDHTIVLYFVKAGIYNELDIAIKVQDDFLLIDKIFDLPNGAGLTAERFWTFIIEIKKADVVGITKVKIK